jgi:hypothetical protein
MLLKRVRRWVEVVLQQRTKCGQLDRDGRPWTRLPAKDLARQLLEQENLVVEERRIQRSLARLTKAGYFARQQRGIWRRDYWYSFVDAEWELQQHRPTAVAKTVTPAKEPSRRQQASPVTVLNLGITSKNQNLSKTEQTRTTSSLDGRSPCADPQHRSGGKRAHSPRSAGKDPLQGLQRAVQRATARGFAAECLPESTVGASTDITRWVEGGFVYERDHLGRVMKDPVATAPLR